MELIRQSECKSHLGETSKNKNVVEYRKQTASERKELLASFASFHLNGHTS